MHSLLSPALWRLCARFFSFRRSGWLITCLFFGACSQQKTPPTHEVYIWQRVWTPAVTEAIEKSRFSFTSYVVLAGEIAWTLDGPTFAKAQVDFAALRRANVKVGLALRIGPYRGSFLTNDKAAKFIREKVRSILSEAEGAGIAPTELQIDFDCAQSKLAGYQVWLEMIQATTGKLPIAITVLPSWLKEAAFRNLATQAGNFILQVHSVQVPVSHGQKPRIFDENLALKWMLRADDLGLPFRVALPTYTNQIITNSQGKIIRICSEDSPTLLPANTTAQFVRTEAQEIASFLQKKRPANLRGWLWYRLPLTTDRRNWRWKTLQAVIGQKPLQSQLVVHVTDTDLTLENSGNLDAELPNSISANWSDSRLVAADALPGWRLERKAQRVLFHPTSEIQQDRLPPGGKVAVGWLRLNPPVEIHLQIP